MAHKHKSDGVSLPKLLFTIFLNILITIAQLIGGIVSGSLALISDAIHNFSDSVSVILAYFAQVLSQKPVTRKSTFGYKRAEILAAFINALALIGISVFLVFEAVDRFQNPMEIDARWMFWLGVLGLFANGISVLVLEREKNKNLNIKAAYLHLMGDALTSLAVILGAVLIWVFKIYWADPLITILISIYLFIHTIKLLKESVTILMQMAPIDLEVSDIENRMMQNQSIKNIHHIHVWNLTDKLIHFECHIELKDDIRVSETNEIFESINKVLNDEFDIGHLTIQFEYRSGHINLCAE
ncbi:MAG: cation transporter [Prolixibacteraceae bacterium]|jgi:cobalt-zinc-cadmium efflux system protein|nr:cation transporter [Prolixibacteraceae bacterium]MBT6765427.1 cation transporter [Prolixibacteraceae bacterium]MBT6997846.1 cation transporter [Prolixibacteraceae bacterium]MBT7394439.1 cation transporter [Prolixibacteraceae bacterium]